MNDMIIVEHTSPVSGDRRLLFGIVVGGAGEGELERERASF